MSSKAFLQGYYGKPRVDHALIEEHSDGIIVLSGCLNSEVSQALLRNDFNFALTAAKRMQEIVRKRKLFYRNPRSWINRAEKNIKSIS
jgi:DNA polymerase-3 subunit alpha